MINFLAQVKEGGDAALEELPAADSKSEISSDIVNSGFEDVHKCAAHHIPTVSARCHGSLPMFTTCVRMCTGSHMLPPCMTAS